jgi:hypothetical protein
MTRKEVHTVHNPNGGWDNQVDGKIVSHAETKADAQKDGRQIAINIRAEHIIHGEDGKIQDSNSYGNDPNPPKDKD